MNESQTANLFFIIIILVAHGLTVTFETGKQFVVTTLII